MRYSNVRVCVCVFRAWVPLTGPANVMVTHALATTTPAQIDITGGY